MTQAADTAGTKREWTKTLFAFTRAETDFTKIQSPCHPAGQRLLYFWYAHKLPGQIPKEGLFSSASLMAERPWTMVVEPCAKNQIEWQFAFFGSALADRLGISTEGLRLTEVFSPNQISNKAELNRRQCQSGAPIIQQGVIRGIGRDRHRLETTRIVVESDIGTVRKIMTGVFFFDDPETSSPGHS